jgi:hypothetical protein
MTEVKFWYWYLSNTDITWETTEIQRAEIKVQTLPFNIPDGVIRF